jgi:hypothetical protein
LRGIIDEEEELDELLKETDITITFISETKRKLQGTKDTRNYSIIYSGVKQNTNAQF